MILEHQYPICEFDTDRNAVIQAAGFLEKTLPEKCVITFFRKELLQLVEERQLPVIGRLYSEVMDSPIYQYTAGNGETICLLLPFMTAPGAATTIEDLHAMGCERFLICGGAGSLRKGNRVGQIVVPTAAVRDEGTSYHYLPPAREVECHRGAADYVLAALEKLGLPHTAGKTWTTDVAYRETPALVERRREEGCLTVEMEAAAFFALSEYYDLPLSQLLYIGDDVSGREWDKRSWDSRKSIRENLIALSLKLMEEWA